MIPDACVVIRSVGERTEALSMKLILEQGIPEAYIYVVNETPFSAAMRTGFELGIKSGCEWTYCIDADVLLRPGSISSMVSAAQKRDKTTCEIQGFVLDKFFGGPRPAGNHLYRSSLLSRVLRRIPDEGMNIRPEYHALQTMRRDGYSWNDLPIVIGLHDSEQYYRDIYRKCFVQAHKHVHLAELFLDVWKEKSSVDADMRVALAGFVDGINHAGDVRIDTGMPYYSFDPSKLEIEEKGPIILSEWNGDRVKKIVSQWQVPPLFRKYFPASTRGTENTHGSLRRRLHKRLQKRGPFLGSAYLFGSILEKLGRALADTCD